MPCPCRAVSGRIVPAKGGFRAFRRQTGTRTVAQIADKTGSKKTLTDSDISTYQRRSGPSGGVVGTDADAHVTPQAGHDADVMPQAGHDADVMPKAGHDVDAAPKAHSDADAAPARDRDA